MSDLPEDIQVAEALAMLLIAAVQIAKENPVEGESTRDTVFRQIVRDLGVEEEDHADMLHMVELAINSHEELIRSAQRTMS